ncbi:MAG: NusG domain II-containing protein [Bacillota bacterium]|nr:NusG domain II-containing protein [Bacillota bacterium]
MSTFKIRVADYLIVGLILVIGVTGFWFNLNEVRAAENKYARIYVQNRLVAELSLPPGDSFTYEFKFGDKGQHTAVIEVDDGRIRMLPLSEDLCPQGICSHTGWIEHSYESIVCLPNQIMIVFVEDSFEKEERDIDGVTF